MHHNEALREACEARFTGKVFAFTASNAGGGLSRLSVVVDGETGHYPLSTDVACGTRDEMRRVADQLNLDRLHLSIDLVTNIIAGSMRSETRRPV